MTQQHTFYLGNTLDVLKTLPDGSVHCVVSSPPYWGLRDYGTGQWIGGDPNCDHRPSSTPQSRGIGTSTLDGGKATTGHQAEGYRQACARCGAVRVDEQIGLESTPDKYVAKMVEVFREVKRVLRGDGTLWLNLGDSYAGSWGAMSYAGDDIAARRFGGDGEKIARPVTSRLTQGLKAKNLIGIPWRVALALQADGWWLRSDIVWAKPNPMPESVTDRPTRSHEYLFLLSKRKRYFYDATAMQEPQICPQDSTEDDIARALNWRRTAQAEPRQDVIEPHGRTGHNAFRGQGVNRQGKNGPANRDERDMRDIGLGAYRNKRDVWTVASQPFSGAHFAVFPESLVEPCILAGTSEYGVCPQCGAPWVRVTSKRKAGPEWNQQGPRTGQHTEKSLEEGRGKFPVRYETTVETTGWRPTCSCDLPPIPATVMDPFGGSGTVSVVAQRLGRSSIYIDLKPEYREMAVARIDTGQPSLMQPFEIRLEEIA